jgi:hypothetical protein
MQRPPYRFPTILDGTPAVAFITRFTREQSFAFRSASENIGRLSARTTKALETATDEQLDAITARVNKENAAAEEFEFDAIRRYVSLEAPITVDGAVVQTGEELISAFSGHRPTVILLSNAVMVHNTFTESSKNQWRSRHGSAGGSAVASAAPNGPTPASPATSASSEGSRSPAGV